MDPRQRFKKRNPDFPLLELSEPRLVEDHLRSLSWLRPGEEFLGCARAGEGNMNLTLRVHATARTFIVKQSRPWVEKYDQIAAPFDRALVEAAFYRRVAPFAAVAERMPQLLAADDASRCLCFEDLGEGADASSIYDPAAANALSAEDLEGLGEYLQALHDATRGAGVEEGSGVLRNRDMRQLNYEHLYDLPLRPDNGVALEEHEPGLSDAARALQADQTAVVAVRELGELYLADAGRRDVLLHGDFFPGCWLRSGDGRLQVIDPEFTWFGPAEFDWGVAAGHLALARQSWDLTQAFLSRANDLNLRLVARCAGAEIVRRLVGVAQLPIPPTDDGWRARMLEVARVALRESQLEVLWS